MRALFRLPNLVTCVRIALTPAIVLTLLKGDCPRAFWLSLLAGFTDAADGYLARRMDLVTRLGAYLDPIADKLLLTAIFLCFGVTGMAPAWLVWLVVGRDVMILMLAAAGLITKRVRDFPPSVWGKLSTVMQIAAALTIISGCAYGIRPGLVRGMIFLTAGTTIWSGVHYFARGIRSIITLSH